MTKICRLLSTIEDIPHQTLSAGDLLSIGRNRVCKIRDIKCSRTHCSVTFDGNSLSVHYIQTNRTENLTNGQFLTGIGFQYKIAFIAQNEDSIDGTNGRQLDEISEQKQLSSEDLIQPMIKEPKTNCLTTEWQTFYSNRVYICRFLGGGQSSRSIAAFDFDGTLVGTKTGNSFAINSNDWKVFDKSLPKKIESLIENGFRFVVISNQLSLSQGRYKLEDIQHRFESALEAIGIPCLVMIAAYDDIYRKPRPGLWQLLADEFNDKLPIDLKTSFYVGDAAGRKKQLNGKSDHSSADLLFAANSCIPFLTPERFLSDVKPKPWDLSKTSYSGLTISTFRPNRSDITFIGTKVGSDQHIKDINSLLESYSKKLHVIVFCGLPASGKSSFYSNHLERYGYCYISRDELKTMEKCQKKCQNYLQNKRNCVIDNLNVDVPSRKRWLDLCRQYSATALLFYFDVSVELALHNNKFRRVIGITSPVTDLVIRSQNKNFVKPLPSEGFESIFKMNFVPKFGKEEHELLYYMFLSER